MNLNSTQKAFTLLSTSALAAGAAQGAVLYTPINITIPGNGKLNLDLNQDSEADFLITGGSTKPQIDNTPSPAGTAYVLSQSADMGLPLTTVATVIDGTYESAQPKGYFNQKNVEGVGGVTVGDWTAAGDNEGYVGLELTDGLGTTNYGWAHFVYNATNKVPNVNATGTLRLIDAAMETTPNVGIPAGQTAEAGVPVVSVPPSSTTGYLGGTAQLTVIAQGFPAPSFQWRAGAVGSGVYTNLPNGAGVSHGALNDLTLRNLTLANMADYVVVASNSSGSVTSSVPATLTVLPQTSPATLVHRYSFQDPVGSTTFADSVGGSAWDGTLQGNAALTGSSLQLDGSYGCYATLPSYIMSSYTAMTVEFWADIASNTPNWSYVFSFGDQAGGAKASGLDYSPYAGGNWQNSDLRGGDGSYVYANKNANLLGATGTHVTLIADPVNGVLCFYNGASLVSNLNATNPVPSLAAINDVNNWIGASLHSIDPYLAGTIHEFRIYEGVLPVQNIALNDATGPDQYIELSATPPRSAPL